jgi:hypothetical protein
MGSTRDKPVLIGRIVHTINHIIRTSVLEVPVRLHSLAVGTNIGQSSLFFAENLVLSFVPAAKQKLDKHPNKSENGTHK